MQENNIHYSYPGTVVVHANKTILYVAVPPGATWRHARVTAATLLGMDPELLRLGTREEGGALITAEDALIEWPPHSGNNVDAVVYKRGSDDKWVRCDPHVWPERSSESVEGDISPTVALYVKGM